MNKKELNTLIESVKKIAEDINVPINVGDEVLSGRFKNKKIRVKEIGKNKKGDITINDKPLLKVRTIQKENINDNKIGKIFWFEYHCDESTSSCDRHLFLHSHQQVTVLSRGKDDHDEFPEEPKTYSVKFSDGLIGDVFEDELMNSRKEFYRPNPPKI